MTAEEPMPLKRMNTPTAKKLEGLVSMHQDLRYVMQLTHAAVELITNKDCSDNLLLQTYWSAALNAYARPFKDGVRQEQLKPDIFSGISGAPETHDYFMKQRDKLIAHSVNPFEEVGVGVFVSPEGKVVGTGELAAQLVATSVEGFRDLNQMAKIGTEDLMKKIEKQRELLVAEASKMSPNELRKLENVRFTAPEPSRAGDSRAKSPKTKGATKPKA